MLAAILVMALGAVVIGAALGYASVRFRVEGDPLVEKIDAILPQTQCGQCNYPGCKPYAEERRCTIRLIGWSTGFCCANHKMIAGLRHDTNES